MLSTLLLDPARTTALIILNDGIADGRDISWVWDADFEVAAGRFETRRASAARAPRRWRCASSTPSGTKRRLDVEPDVDGGARHGARRHAGGRMPHGRSDLHRDARPCASCWPRRAGRDALLAPDERAATLRLGHLYPSLMNIYGDRGNIICLQRRCRLRGIDLQVTPLEVGDALEPDAFDLLFMGGAQDREQRLVADDLRRDEGGPLREAVEDGVVFLGVCGGYQLAGRFYRGADGEELRGAGVFDLYTLHPGPEARSA